MATDTLNELKSAALLLPSSERAALAHALVKSLDEPADEGVADAWDREIMRRLATIENGTAMLVDRDEFRRRLRARLDRS
jgi:putative addiction module component (TIGR02574 family)